MSENLSELLGRKGLDENLFDKLGNLALPNGTPDEAELALLAEEFLVGKANTFGTATFYDFLKPENKGKEVYICNGTACECAGTQTRIYEKVNAVFNPEQIGHMTCLGRCHENAAFHYRGQNYSGSDIDQLEEIVRDGGQEKEDQYSVGASHEAILTKPFPGIASYYKAWQKVLELHPETVLEEIKTSNLRGRGGAGFPHGAEARILPEGGRNRKVYHLQCG